MSFDWLALMPGFEQSIKTNFGQSNDPRSPSASVQSFLLLGVDVSFAVREWGQEDTTKGIQLMVARDVMAAMLVFKNKNISILWKLKSIFMQIRWNDF